MQGMPTSVVHQDAQSFALLLQSVPQVGCKGTHRGGAGHVKIIALGCALKVEALQFSMCLLAAGTIAASHNDVCSLAHQAHSNMFP